MSRIKKVFFLTLSLLLCTSVFANDLKRHMNADLDFIKEIFEIKYAPLEWKKSYANWDLDEQIELAKAKVASLDNPTAKDFRPILTHFFNSTGDYHVKPFFYSTEEAQLPFTVQCAEGRYFFAHIERNFFGFTKHSFSVGDEILAFDGRAPEEVVQELLQQQGCCNTPETDRELTILKLTHRQGKDGDLVPRGPITITVKERDTGAVIDHTFTWRYAREKVKEPRQKSARLLKMGGGFVGSDHKSSKKKSFFNHLMLSPHWFLQGDAKKCQNPHLLGARKGYLPDLGHRLWQTSFNHNFDAYIYQTDGGKLVGYIRIPHYMCDEEEAQEFEQVMHMFDKHTDMLVIDQINNSGGSVFYLYALASMLTDRYMHTPQHHIALTQEEVMIAQDTLENLDDVVDDHSAQQLLGESLGGYAIDYEFAQKMRQFCNFILKEWQSGHYLTKPIFFFGVDDIKPHPRVQYTKPILLLINSLDFSGGDFFPAILQDNGRAMVMGTRTAGAGGIMLDTEFYNRVGLANFILTGSLAMRSNNHPIENLGVVPDIQYDLTCDDLRYNYRDYKKKILSTVDEILLQE